MSAPGGGEVVVGPLEDFAAMRRLGVACGIEDEGRDDEASSRPGAPATERGSWAASRSSGTPAWTRPNWLAVDERYRRRGIAAALYDALEREARARGMRRLWVTARAPAFFLAQGFEPVEPGTERDALLGGCLECDQFGRECEPRALTKRLDVTGLDDS